MLTEFGLQGTNSLVSDKDTHGYNYEIPDFAERGGGETHGDPPPSFTNQNVKTFQPTDQNSININSRIVNIYI